MFLLFLFNTLASDSRGIFVYEHLVNGCKSKKGAECSTRSPAPNKIKFHILNSFLRASFC